MRNFPAPQYYPTRIIVPLIVQDEMNTNCIKIQSIAMLSNMFASNYRYVYEGLKRYR